MVTQYARQYQQTQIMTASSVQIVVLLYDAAIQSIELARVGIERPVSGPGYFHRGRAE